MLTQDEQFNGAGRLWRLDVVVLQDRVGLQFRWREEIALVRPEAWGRLEVTTASGEVLYHPEPLEALAGAPLVAGEGMLVHPRHARLRDGRLEFKAGWRVPWSGPLPEAARPPLSPRIPHLGVRQDDVVYLHAERNKTRWVVLGKGEIPDKEAAVHARRHHPGLIQAGYHYINPRRLRTLVQEKHRYRLHMEGGVELTVYKSALAPFLAGLGRARVDTLEGWTPQARVLLEHGLRDWPRELFTADERFLRASLGRDFAYTVESVLWQTVRMRAAGLEPDYNTDFRGYWYRPLLVVLTRLGLLARDEVGRWLADGTADPELVRAFHAMDPDAVGALQGRDFYRDYQVIAGELVGTDGLFRYSDLGFEEPRPDLREIGAERPGVVVLAEKATTRSMVRKLARAFGASSLILGGQASLLVTEFFARALRERWSGPVRIAAYVDYDPWGWIIARAFADQLQRFGVEVEEVGFLVRPARFTDEELRQLPVPLPDTTETVRATVRNWMGETRGVKGRRLGIHADHLRPLERLVRAMEQETGLAPLVERDMVERCLVRSQEDLELADEFFCAEQQVWDSNPS